MNAIDIIRALLSAYGVAADGFIVFLRRLMAKGSVPDEAQTQIVDWLTANLGIDEERAGGLALLVLAELKSGEPGYWQNAGLSA